MNTSHQLFLKESLENELINILDYWKDHCWDEQNGGFSPINPQGANISRSGLKEAVLNGRCLYAFSVGYKQTKKPAYLVMAEKSYQYICEYFLDKADGFVYTALNLDNSVASDDKDSYSGSFIIYGLTEYYKASGNQDALQTAKELCALLLDRFQDPVSGGFYDTFTRDFSSCLETKSLRAHLHVLECGTYLYEVTRDPSLRKAMLQLLKDLLEKGITKDHYLKQHFTLSFEELWKEDSFGDDIEGAWLFPECLEILLLPSLEEKEPAPDLFLVKDGGSLGEAVNTLALELLDHVLTMGFDPADGCLYAKFNKGQLETQRSWWMECEAMNAFMYWYQKTGEEKYFHMAEDLAIYLRTYFIKGDGTWASNIAADNTEPHPEKMANCPYHNVRTCLRVARSFNSIL